MHLFKKTINEDQLLVLTLLHQRKDVTLDEVKKNPGLCGIELKPTLDNGDLSSLLQMVSNNEISVGQFLDMYKAEEHSCWGNIFNAIGQFFENLPSMICAVGGAFGCFCSNLACCCSSIIIKIRTLYTSMQPTLVFSVVKYFQSFSRILFKTITKYEYAF